MWRGVLGCWWVGKTQASGKYKMALLLLRQAGLFTVVWCPSVPRPASLLAIIRVINVAVLWKPNVTMLIP
uniref:Putative secreted protein n=1 Tax=Anopheles marajoara TaxID=58244 RepID=A0A2M4CEH3_9DIPT